jgi:bacterioferritin
MLRESLETEAQALGLYRGTAGVVEGRSVALEEFARQMIQPRSARRRVDKMLRKPGELATFSKRPASAKPKAR